MTITTDHVFVFTLVSDACNGIAVTMRIPQPGRAAHYSVRWRGPQRPGDAAEYERLKAIIVAHLATVSGRTHRMVDEETCEPVEAQFE